MHNLFSNDRMIVKGEYREYVNVISSKETETVPHILLQFTFQVNGKLKEFTQSFEIAKGEEFGIGNELTLRNYTVWYAIQELFVTMEYRFRDFEKGDLSQTPDPIGQWIERVVPQESVLFDKQERKVD